MVDDVPNEQRLDHLQTGDHQGQQKDRTQSIAVRPKPTEVVPQVGAPGALRAGRRGRGATLVRLRYLVEAPVFIVFDELLVALPGRTSGAHETT
jgi:hypothetical protein